MTIDPLLASDDELFGDLPTSAAEVYANQARTLGNALEPREQLPAVVNGLLQPGGLYLLYSSPGQLKTMLAIDLAMSVALGEPWLPGVGNDPAPGFSVMQGPVLWVDQDNGRDVMDERVAAMGRAYGVTDAPLFYLSFPLPGIAASRGLTALTFYARSINASLVIFDNLLRVAGVRDENAAEMDLAMGNLRLFAEETGAAVIVIHHRRKDTAGREGDSIRGHGSIEASLDAAFLVTREDDIATVKCTKARRRPIEPFAARWTYELADDSDWLFSARFWRSRLTDKRQEAESAMRADILAALEDGPKSTSQIVGSVGGRKSDVVSMLVIMRDEGAIVCEPGPRGAKIYRLP